MILCKDCKHCRQDEDEKLSRCIHPSMRMERVSVVTGEIIRAWKSPLNEAQDYEPFCITQRRNSGDCGPDAKLFEPIEQ